MKTRQLFICDCGSPEHQFIVERWVDNDPGFSYLFFQVHFTLPPFWWRIIRAFRYVFGSTCGFEEVMLQRPEIIQLRDVIDEFLIETE